MYLNIGNISRNASLIYIMHTLYTFTRNFIKPIIPGA